MVAVIVDSTFCAPALPGVGAGTPGRTAHQENLAAKSRTGHWVSTEAQVCCPDEARMGYRPKERKGSQKTKMWKNNVRRGQKKCRRNLSKAGAGEQSRGVRGAQELPPPRESTPFVGQQEAAPCGPRPASLLSRPERGGGKSQAKAAAPPPCLQPALPPLLTGVTAAQRRAVGGSLADATAGPHVLLPSRPHLSPHSSPSCCSRDFSKHRQGHCCVSLGSYLVLGAHPDVMAGEEVCREELWLI